MQLVASKLRRSQTTPGSIDDPCLHAALMQHVRQTPPDASPAWGLGDYVNAAAELSAAMPLARSIDTYMDDHKTDLRIQI